MLLLVLFLFINVVTLSSMIIKKISKGWTIRNNRRGGGAIPKKNLCKGNLSDKKWHRKKKLSRQVS